MKKSTNSIKSNICKYLLIPIIVIIDLIMLIVITPLTDGKTYSNHKGVYTYDELFSSKTEVDMKDIISVLSLSDTGITEIRAKEFLSDVSFETVERMKAIAIMILYNPKNEICSLNTLSMVGSLLDKLMISDEDVYKISNAKDYVVRGTIFTFNNEIYMFANLKDDSYIFDEESSARDNAIRSTIYLCNKKIGLFKLHNIDEIFIENNFVEHGQSYTKTYPNWYGKIQDMTKYKIIACVLFLLQFPIAFKIYSKVITPKTESNKKKKAKK